MAEQRLKHFGWGREGEGMTPAEETAALDSSNRGRRRNVLCRCSGGGLGGRGSGGWRVLGRRWPANVKHANANIVARGRYARMGLPFPRFWQKINRPAMALAAPGPRGSSGSCLNPPCMAPVLLSAARSRYRRSSRSSGL
jgi:hypothetical protein